MKNKLKFIFTITAMLALLTVITSCRKQESKKTVQEFSKTIISVLEEDGIFEKSFEETETLFKRENVSFALKHSKNDCINSITVKINGIDADYFNKLQYPNIISPEKNLQPAQTASINAIRYSAMVVKFFTEFQDEDCIDIALDSRYESVSESNWSFNCKQSGTAAVFTAVYEE